MRAEITQPCMERMTQDLSEYCNFTPFAAAACCAWLRLLMMAIWWAGCAGDAGALLCAASTWRHSKVTLVAQP